MSPQTRCLLVVHIQPGLYTPSDSRSREPPELQKAQSLSILRFFSSYFTIQYMYIYYIYILCIYFAVNDFIILWPISDMFFMGFCRFRTRHGSWMKTSSRPSTLPPAKLPANWRSYRAPTRPMQVVIGWWWEDGGDSEKGVENEGMRARSSSKFQKVNGTIGTNLGLVLCT